MAHHCRVVGQSDISRLVVYRRAAASAAASLRRGHGLAVNNKGAFDIDAHRARVDDSAVDLVRRHGLRPGVARSSVLHRPVLFCSIASAPHEERHVAK